MQYSRIDLAELKAQLVKRVGAERSKRYFYYLNKLLSQKLSKREFDKLCFRELGRENVSLHNHLVRSILKNACQASTPPPPVPPKKLDGTDQSGSQLFPNPNLGPVWSNGVLPPSPPKKLRSMARGKPKDRPSPLGINGKIDHHEENGGDLNPCDYGRPVQNHLLQPAAELPRRTPLVAPLGIPFCSASVGGSRRVAPAAATAGGGDGFYEAGGLSDAESTRRRMERITAAEGLSGGVSPECAETVNAMLDVYLKRLIKSCVELVGAKKKKKSSGGGNNINNNNNNSSSYYNNAQKSQVVQGKVVNGMWPSNHMHNNGGEANQGSISLLDFKVAMELNPKQLGEDWPVLLEKISMHSFEE